MLNRRSYAQRHGYEYCEFDGTVEAFRPYGFQKLVALRHVLRGRVPGALVWYLDADALIMNHSIAIGELVRDYAQDLVFTSEPESKRDHALRCMLVDTLKVKMSAIKGIEDFSIQGGSFVVRNTPWALATMNTVSDSGAGSMIVPWLDGARVSDRAQWVLWPLGAQAQA